MCCNCCGLCTQTLCMPILVKMPYCGSTMCGCGCMSTMCGCGCIGGFGRVRNIVVR
ncbi:MAG: hypothetical protein LBN09_03680 [Clostridioides sp.]|nr:hypothetical protein [Clostridioides sp.]